MGAILPLAQSRITDSRGRVARKLRISVTDRCNFACLFCMPQKERIRWLPKEEILSFEEITRVTRILVSLGVEKVRLTGGEPLLRREIEKLVKMLSTIDGIKSLDMTTNGWFLREKARALKQAGLRGVTVSLHSLRPDRFARISGMDALPRVLEGIDAAYEAGLSPIKINSVAIRGYNEDEIIDLVEFARERDFSIRFIEFMPLDGLGVWSPERMIPGREILDLLSSRYRLTHKGREPGGTATLWAFEDGRGEVGVITSMTEPFCDDCDRIRLTADGKILTCLFDTRLYDLKPLLRGSGSDEEIATYIQECFLKKPGGVAYMPLFKKLVFERVKPRAMYAIGG
jgi:cyclic pyranopterin phosphate synthase